MRLVNGIHYNYMTLIFNRGSDRLKRRQLRQNKTTPEDIVWFQLRDRRLNGPKFRRQYSVGPYVVDFYCPDRKLAIEIDGDTHFTADAQKYDQERTVYLESIGVTVIRFTNKEVMDNLNGVLERIAEYIL